MGKDKDVNNLITPRKAVKLVAHKSSFSGNVKSDRKVVEIKI